MPYRVRRFPAFLLIIAIISCAACSSTAPDPVGIDAVGCFENVASNGEHADGYTVRVWSQGKNMMGLITWHQGLIGDPPIGTLENVQYDASTGRLAFEAKLTSGLHSCRIHQNVPSHDFLSFTGSLTSDVLEGMIRVEDRLDPLPSVVERRQGFAMPRKTECSIEDYPNHQVWLEYWEPVLKARGPQW